MAERKCSECGIPWPDFPDKRAQIAWQMAHQSFHSSLGAVAAAPWPQDVPDDLEPMVREAVVGVLDDYDQLTTAKSFAGAVDDIVRRVMEVLRLAGLHG